jgi:hypothetical protein
MTLPRRAVLAAAALPLLAPGCAAAGPVAPMPLAVPPDTALRPLGALLLDREALGIAGLSGLHLSPDLRLSAVSDRGRWLTARLLLRDDRPIGLDEIRTGALRNGDGTPLRRGLRGDAEALARLPDGTWLIAYERWHRIRAHRPGLDAPGRYVDAPAELARAPANAGLEAMTVLPDGRILLIAEGMEAGPGLRRAWLGRPGAWTALAYRPAPGMDPVDATTLPDGDVLVLERSFSLLGGFGGRLVRLPQAALAGPVLEPGAVLLRIEPPLPVDNYEGVAAARVGGRTLVALVSDDNEHMLQRSWLLLLALEGRG